MCIQVGFLINKDHCLYTEMVNKIIDPNTEDNHIFRGTFGIFLTHYVRGDSWAYRNYNFRNSTILTGFVKYCIIVFIIVFMRILIKKGKLTK